MRTLFRFLSLLLCLELIVAPVNADLSFIGKAFGQSSCASGMSFDSILNRCLTTTETANVMNATASCGGDVNCYKENAQKAFQEKVNKGEAPERKENNQFMSTVAGAAAIAGPVTIAAAAMSTGFSVCKSPSFWTMIAGSAALFGGDLIANNLHKKRLKKIRDEWGKIVNPEDAKGDQDKIRQANTEAQSQAFEMLARSEDSLVKAAKTKRNLFLVASAAYAASAIYAYGEIAAFAALGLTGTGAIFLCPKVSSIDQKNKESLYAYYSSGRKGLNLSNTQSIYNLKHSPDIASLIVNQIQSDETLSSPSIEDYFEVKKSFSSYNLDKDLFEQFKEVTLSLLSSASPIPSAFAQEVNTNAARAYKEDEGKSSSVLLTMGLSAGMVAAVLAAKVTTVAKMFEPKGRAIFAGIMSLMSLTMASHAGSQAEASEKRAELLRKMRDDFVSASGALNACKSEDRNDTSKPNCYCYTPDNQRNPNRTASQVCNKLWTGLNQGSPIASNNPLETSKICINNKNQADESCSCKSNNTCMKVGFSPLKGLSSGTLSMLNSAIDPLGKIVNGSVDAASLDSASLSNQAMNMQRALSSLDKNKNTKDLIKDKGKQEAQLMANLNKASTGLDSNNLLGSTGSSGLPSNPGEAAVMLEKELDEAKSAETTSHSSEGTALQTNAPAEALEFGLTAEDAKAQESQIAEVMKQDLDYGTNDINQGSKTNIFEVLSNRYQRSGMRRLFDEKGTTKADSPAQTDINK